jgi:hypothetical protein
MAKDLIVFKDTKKKSKIPKGNILAKASREQKFLGKTLPKALWGVAKFAWKHPISTTATWLIGEKMLKTRPGLKFPKHRQFDKRGRKFI